MSLCMSGFQLESELQTFPGMSELVGWLAEVYLLRAEETPEEEFISGEE